MLLPWPTSSEAKWSEAAADGKVSKETWDKWVADEVTTAKATAAAEGAVAAIDTGGDGQISKEECGEAGHSPEKVEEIFTKVQHQAPGSR